ncbi:MAG: transcription repressor NadR [Bacillus sp. (in: firmicutes)]
MNRNQKLSGDLRRNEILTLLKGSNQPLTGSQLAKIANVSRQIIVGDITLLKAKNEPIIATSQGYIYLQQNSQSQMHERILACSHAPNDTEQELQIIVDTGAYVKDVKVEHPIYGDISASIMVHNRREVQQFLDKMQKSNASYLSQLTNGMHLHTICAASQEILDEAEETLRKAGFLIEEND